LLNSFQEGFSQDLFDICSLSIPDISRQADCNREWARSWLSEIEYATYIGFSHARRRRHWLAGRYAAKQVIARRDPSIELAAIEIATIDDCYEQGRPIYRVAHVAGRYGLSISHAGDVAAAALAKSEHVRIGIDVEPIDARIEEAEPIALGDDERATLATVGGPERWRAVTRIWTLKEALMKALGCGLRLEPTAITVDLPTSTFRFTPPSDVASFSRIRAGVAEQDETLFAWVLLD
jgi:phosphopantetheinyl transferase